MKASAAIEISDAYIKLVVGYVIDNKIYPITVKSVAIDGFIEHGHIKDETNLLNAIKELTSINDSESKLNLTICDAILVLPSIGVEIYEANEITTVVGEDSKISELDIKNLFSLVRKEKIDLNNVVTTIIPDVFIIDGDKGYRVPPMGETSSTITVKAKIHTAPKQIVEDLNALFLKANINITRTFIGAFLSNLMVKDNVDVDSYFLANVNEKQTFVSLVGHKTLLASTSVDFGLYDLLENIQNEFGVDKNKAYELLNLYGYDTRELSFTPVLAKTRIEETGEEVAHTLTEFNQIVKNFLDHLIANINSSIGVLSESYDERIKSIPLVLVGNGGDIKGFEGYIEPKIISEKLYRVKPNIIGVNSSFYINGLGAIKANVLYPESYDDIKNRISTISRVEE